MTPRKPKPGKTKEAKAVRARALWSYPFEDGYILSDLPPAKDDKWPIAPVSVLPRTPATNEAMILQVATALATHAYSRRVEDYHGEAKAALRSLNLLSKGAK